MTFSNKFSTIIIGDNMKAHYLFFIIIPIGMIVLFFALDFGYKIYVENKLYIDASEVFKMALDSEGLDTEEEFNNYINDKFREKGYTEFDLSITNKKDYKLLIIYNSYFSIINQLLHNGSKMSVVRLKGYYNEYKETVIEKYDEEEDDDLIKNIDLTSTTTKQGIVREG